MSALRIPIRVTRTLNVPTMRVLIAVLADKDSLEMELLAKVGKKMQNYPYIGATYYIKKHIISESIHRLFCATTREKS